MMHKYIFIWVVCFLFLVGELAIFAQTKAASCFYPRETSNMKEGKNVLGGELQDCCTELKTGFYRNGRCDTGAYDLGSHVVCAQVTRDFLDYTQAQGNDLETPNEFYRFPGLKVGDKWCLCAGRWKEAYRAGVAPPIFLESTHQAALHCISLEILKSYAIK